MKAASITAALVTWLQIKAPTNVTLCLLEIGISFQGTSNTAAPVHCDLIRQTNGGTMTASGTNSFVSLLDNGITHTIQATAQDTATVEPTLGGGVGPFKDWSIHPQTGLVIPTSDLGEVLVHDNTYLGLRLQAGAGVTADLYWIFEE